MMARPEQPPSVALTIRRAHQRFGWSALAIALLAGALLESLLGVKSSILGADDLRHQLWSLAHFHCAFLAVVNLVYPFVIERTSPARSRALLIGSTLLPLGFFLGGLAHPEGDPGLGIWLAPIGAMLLIYAGVAHAAEVWRKG